MGYKWHKFEKTADVSWSFNLISSFQRLCKKVAALFENFPFVEVTQYHVAAASQGSQYRHAHDNRVLATF
jgi:hypothetical protein